MIVVTVPDEQDVIALQEREEVLYFSIAADSAIRRTGVVNVVKLPLSELDLADPRRHAVLTRMAQPTEPQFAAITARACVCEGPLSEPVLSAFGLEGRVEAVDYIDLHDHSGRFHWRVRRSETSFLDSGPNALAGWQQAQLRVQFIAGAIDEVRFIGRLPDGREVPAVFRVGKAWICAFPLFDVAGEFLVFPPLPARWTNRVTMYRYEDMAAALIPELMARLAADGTMPLVRVGDWPEGYFTALCVRHDYDRPIPEPALQTLLDFYKSRGLVCSIGFLSYESPPPQIQALAAHGHEIQIHVWQSDSEKFREDVAALSALAGSPVVGATTHGNERGFRGDAQYEWYEEVGLEYAELFRISHAPAPIYRLGGSGVLRRSRLMGTPGHFSLDINNNPPTHQLDYIRRYCDGALQTGAAVIPMNHPDINRAALYELLDELDAAKPDGQAGDLSGGATWRASLRDIVRWTRLTRHDSMVHNHAGEMNLRFAARLPHPLPVSIEYGGGAVRRLTAPAGTDSVWLAAEPPRQAA